MFPFFVIGVALLIGAFLAAALEPVARTLADIDGMFASAREVWMAMWPDSLMAGEGWAAEHLPGWLLGPLLATLGTLPGWLILGLPGGLLTWYTRPRRAPAADDLIEDDLFLFDALAARAEAEGYGDEPEGMFTEHVFEGEPDVPSASDLPPPVEWDDEFGAQGREPDPFSDLPEIPPDEVPDDDELRALIEDSDDHGPDPDEPPPTPTPADKKNRGR